MFTGICFCLLNSEEVKMGLIGGWSGLSEAIGKIKKFLVFKNFHIFVVPNKLNFN